MKLNRIKINVNNSELLLMEGAYLWYNSPWGLHKLCRKHYYQWIDQKIDIDDIDESKLLRLKPKHHLFSLMLLKIQKSMYPNIKFFVW